MSNHKVDQGPEWAQVGEWPPRAEPHNVFNAKRKQCPLCGEGHIDKTSYPVLYHPTKYQYDGLMHEQAGDRDAARRAYDAYDFFKKVWMGIE